MAFRPLHFMLLGLVRLNLGMTYRDQPNIVYIVADDVGYGDFSCYGHPTQEYGGVDRMASEGIRFTQAYTPAVFCSPSRMAMLTGQ